MIRDVNTVRGSFRDPSGFVFRHEGRVYRQVNMSYRDHYVHLMRSGLYEDLCSKQMLVRHEEVDLDREAADGAYVILRPEYVPFISYPYEWCPSQLREAALVTLDAQLSAMQHGMTLKDANAYNIQFVQGRATLIDTLSFEVYEEGQPWPAYRQFCQHFLAPLALACFCDVRLTQLLRVHIDGIPLDLASALLRRRTWLRPSLLVHIHLHARAQRHFAGTTNVGKDSRPRRVSRLGLLGLVKNLRSAVAALRWKPDRSEWSQYYEDTNYTQDGMTHKQDLVAGYLERLRPGVVWDLGANTGRFSAIAAAQGARVLSCDVDPVAVEQNYLESVRRNDGSILPLLLDITNPSPGIGWRNVERLSLAQRRDADTILALALVHHLAITHNLPLAMIAEFLAELCESLIIEFVPKEDSQVQRLLASRPDVFPGYTRRSFEEAFTKWFTICDAAGVRDSGRIIYMLERIHDGD